MVVSSNGKYLIQVSQYLNGMKILNMALIIM